jgi:hypothetical protein
MTKIVFNFYSIAEVKMTQSLTFPLEQDIRRKKIKSFGQGFATRFENLHLFCLVERRSFK